jgi:hypothetical protein
MDRMAAMIREVWGCGITIPGGLEKFNVDERKFRRSPDAAQRVALAERCAAEPGPYRARHSRRSRFCEAALRKSYALHRARETDRASSLRRVQRQRNRFDAGKIKLARRGIDIEPEHIAVGIEIDIEPLDNLPRLGARRALQLDIEAVRLRVIMQLHGLSSLKLQSVAPRLLEQSVLYVLQPPLA